MAKPMLAVVAALVVLAAACGSSGDSEPDSTPENTAEATVETATSDGETISINNQGGSMEGHTPRGFAGMGTGLFTGDNLNPGFPEGEGVQIFLTFDIPDRTPAPTEVILVSDALSTSGTPFADLGQLTAEPVTYNSFGPDLFDLAADAPAVICERPEAGSLRCDVTNSVVPLLSSGADRVQLRVKFEQLADNDGQQDLALFFLSESNTNEPGIFHIELT